MFGIESAANIECDYDDRKWIYAKTAQNDREIQNIDIWTQDAQTPSANIMQVTVVKNIVFIDAASAIII